MENIDFLGLLPCALKVPFQEALGAYVKELEKCEDVSTLHYSLVGNANNGLSFFTELKEKNDLNVLPDMIMAPGFNSFYYQNIINKCKESKSIQASVPESMNPLWLDLDLIDPFNLYSVIGFNPTVLLVDRTNDKSLPLPEKWSDLLEPEFEKKLAIRGSNPTKEEKKIEFCEGILLNTYKDHGEEGINKLGKSVNWSLHPSQMVKMAGKRGEGPSISAIPYSFAKLVKCNENISIVWPKDGAIVNPITLLVKDIRNKQSKIMNDFLFSDEVGELFVKIGFPSIHSNKNHKLNDDTSFKWLGWDFIHENDLAKLKPKLNDIFLQSYMSK
ncbi:hypothetical protein BKP45_15780 [Anaerobacillus alkalidiazotrophicus]|uniref:ABC transporter substrate-binding protein n=1 Tax=Anaerobacillus alkalidiazotrophicus TaxID=472963 RepID=A0A1S2M2T9_9BACI|nr:ABC transporter substrate-binding protein [Anaerobacillus alkalidiazotrophicus]OIJ18743.1 hypothetical protein BKP45_15780 [Anaerobacillus alkalidiazotrophicus]